MTADSKNDKLLFQPFEDDSREAPKLNLLTAGSSASDYSNVFGAKSKLSDRDQELFGNLMLCKADIIPLIEEYKDKKWPTREEMEEERVQGYLKELREAKDPAAVANSIYSRMPSKLGIETDGKKISLTTDSATRLLEAIPGLKMTDAIAVKDLKGVTIDGSTLKVDGKAAFEVGPDGNKIHLTLNDLKGDFKVDPKDPTRMTLTNISGLTARKLGADVDLKDITVQLKEDKDGNLTLRVEPGQVKGKEEKGNDLLSSLKTGYNKIGAAIGKTQIEPFELALCNKKDAPVAEVMAQLGKWIQKPEERDAGKVAEALAGLYMPSEFSGLLKGLKGVSKDGDSFHLKSEGGNLHHIGGLPLAWDKDIKLKVEPGNAPKINIESGAKIQLPIPDDVASALGLKNPQEFAIKQLAMSEPDKNGHRVATMKMDGPVDSISVKLDSKMQPVPVDKAGNVQVSAKLRDGNIGLDLTFNPAQVAAGKPDQIDFKLNVSDNHKELPAAIEKFFGHELDPNLRGILTGIRSLERKGDRVTISRTDNSVHELGGLKVWAGKDVSFKLSRDDKGMQIKDLKGVAICSLPGFANTIYATRLPIYLRDVSLSNPDKDGNRKLDIRSEGAVRNASVDLNASMTPTNMWVTVENPVDAFKESLKGRGGLDMFSARLKDNTKYTINIKGNGEVDYGGLSNAADMFSKAGDFLSIEGAAAAGVGYLGKKITGAPPGQAEADLWGTVKKSWNAIFP